MERSFSSKCQKSTDALDVEEAEMSTIDEVARTLHRSSIGSVRDLHRNPVVQSSGVAENPLYQSNTTQKQRLMESE